MTPAELLDTCEHVLLDFDGPVCSVFGTLANRTVAARLVPLLGPRVPRHIEEHEDPFEVLRYAGGLGPNTASSVERGLSRQEVEAVSTAPATPGAAAAVRALHATGHSVTIVSNNGEAAVRSYLDQHALSQYVGDVVARTEPGSQRLKPNPYLLQQAILRIRTTPERCVMVGDSVSDIDAARSAGTAVIAYANKPGKREVFAGRSPDAIIDDMSELSPITTA